MVKKLISLLLLLDEATLACVVKFLRGVQAAFGKKK
jgi:hypothetical protein